MRELNIEWRHYAREGVTCARCSATGTSAKDVVAELTQKLAVHEVRVSFSETLLPAELMAQSNMILFNGVPLEEVLGNAVTGESECKSCSCLAGADTNCRTVVHEGIIHEEIPAELIRQAALIVMSVAK